MIWILCIILSTNQIPFHLTVDWQVFCLRIASCKIIQSRYGVMPNPDWFSPDRRGWKHFLVENEFNLCCIFSSFYAALNSTKMYKYKPFSAQYTAVLHPFTYTCKMNAFQSFWTFRFEWLILRGVGPNVESINFPETVPKNNISAPF